MVDSKGCYVNDNNAPVILDNQYYVLLTPFLDDIVRILTKVDKTLYWSSYRVIRVVKIEAPYVISSTIRIFSSQYYFRSDKIGLFTLYFKGRLFTFTK